MFKNWKFIKILVVHMDVVATLSGCAPGTNMSTIQTFYSRSDVIPLLSPSVDRPREFGFNPSALRNYSDAYAHASYSNCQVGMEGLVLTRSGGI